MKKQQIEIERSLRSTSANIIWGIISTEGGMGKWLADEVKAVDDKFFFTWGDEWSHHEKRCANTLERVRHSHIRLRWADETDPEAYLEMRMVHNEMTDGYSLHVTDFALPEDLDSLYDIWEQNFDQLRQATGLLFRPLVLHPSSSPSSRLIFPYRQTLSKNKKTKKWEFLIKLSYFCISTMNP